MDIMLKTISSRRAEKILGNYDSWIRTLALRYRIPEAFIKAILYQEMTEMDLMDYAADAAVYSNLTGKKDSSTGYAQIFGKTGVKAVNAAVKKGLTSYSLLHIESDHLLDENNPEDVRILWKLLHRNPAANMEIAVLNMLACAEEMTGKTDFDSFSPEEMKLILTRYNADTDHITQYGESTYRHYLRYMNEKGKEKSR